MECKFWVAIEASSIFGAPQVPRPRLDVAPTELATILLSDCYKDVAPTELR